MSTLSIRANELPRPLPGLGRIVAYLSLLADAFGEALMQTRDARRKYPFADV